MCDSNRTYYDSNKMKQRLSRNLDANIIYSQFTHDLTHSLHLIRLIELCHSNHIFNDSNQEVMQSRVFPSNLFDSNQSFHDSNHTFSLTQIKMFISQITKMGFSYVLDLDPSYFAT